MGSPGSCGIISTNGQNLEPIREKFGLPPCKIAWDTVRNTIFNSLTYSFSSATKIEKLSNCQSKAGLVMDAKKIIMGEGTLN